VFLFMTPCSYSQGSVGCSDDTSKGFLSRKH